MKFPLVGDLAAEGFPVRLTYGVRGFSAQAFYKCQFRVCSDRDWADDHVANAIRDVHDDDLEFGYQFIAGELERAGRVTDERRVWRLCQENRIWSSTTETGRRSTGKTPEPTVDDNLVQRDFTAARLDQVWLTQVTEYPTAEGKVYPCAIKGLCSHRIVGNAIDDRMTENLAVGALCSVIARLEPAGTDIVRSNRGGQFRSRSFRVVLTAARLRGSMGHVASAGDNEAIESFHSLLQKNVLNRRCWRARDELHYAVIT